MAALEAGLGEVILTGTYCVVHPASSVLQYASSREGASSWQPFTFAFAKWKSGWSTSATVIMNTVAS